MDTCTFCQLFLGKVKLKASATDVGGEHGYEGTVIWFDRHACKCVCMHTTILQTVISILLFDLFTRDKDRFMSPQSQSLAFAFLTALSINSAQAASDADINKLTTYAVMLGRAAGCGLSVTGEASQVGSWMDRRFKPGSADQKTYLPIFMAGVRENADRQSRGLSPDDCSTVREQFSLVSWP